MTKRLVVWLEVSAEHEQEFNRWYESEYIPRFAEQIPGVTRVSRWRTPDERVYLTVYDLESGCSLDAVANAIRSPARDADRARWREWQDKALVTFHDGLFDEVFAFQPDDSAPVGVPTGSDR